MATETEVTLRLDSASLFKALRNRVGNWQLRDHTFSPAADEIKMSYDVGGTGRVALTIAFEFDAQQMAQLLSDARPVP